MPSKRLEVPGIGPVLFVKSARSRTMRLSVTPQGTRVSLPRWTPYAAAVAFAAQHRTWIVEHRQKHRPRVLLPGQKLGKLHTLEFVSAPAGTTRLTRSTATKVVVRMLPGEAIEHPDVQARAHDAAVRAMKKEAALLLPARLHNHATAHGIEYSSVSIKQLKRRWGSCDSRKHIALNLYLMELPWSLIDYVLCHELAHTHYMHHQTAFWEYVDTLYPYARQARRQLSNYQPLCSASPIDPD